MKDYPNRTSIMVEHLDEKKSTQLYDELWDIIQHLLSKEEEAEKRRKNLRIQQKTLATTLRTLKEQKEDGFEDIEGEENGEIDYRKLYKTIMCPLKNDCPKVKLLRWPYSSIKSH